MIKLQSLKNRLPQSMKDQRGASAIEYAVLVGLVAIVIIAVVGTDGSDALGGALNTAFGKITTALGDYGS